MFVRTQRNKLINIDNITCVYPAKYCDDYALVGSIKDKKDFIFYTGTKEETRCAMETLYEAICKGASIISYYEGDI